MKSIENCNNIIHQKGYCYNLYKLRDTNSYYMQLFYGVNYPNNRIEIEENDLKILFNKAIDLIKNK